MEGFIFELKTKQFNRNYYFIECDNTRKTNAIAKRFLEYFMKKYENCGYIPLNIIQNTLDNIYKTMYKATLIDKSKELKCYHIHTKYSGESVPKEVVTIIK